MSLKGNKNNKPSQANSKSEFHINYETSLDGNHIKQHLLTPYVKKQMSISITLLTAHRLTP